MIASHELVVDEAVVCHHDSYQEGNCARFLVTSFSTIVSGCPHARYGGKTRGSAHKIISFVGGGCRLSPVCILCNLKNNTMHCFFHSEN